MLLWSKPSPFPSSWHWQKSCLPSFFSFIIWDMQLFYFFLTQPIPILDTPPLHLDLCCPSSSFTLRFCLLIHFEWAINHHLPHDKVWDTCIFILRMIILLFFETTHPMWHSATPSTSPLSILFSQSLIAVVNSFWTRHQSCFNSLCCILTEVAYFTNDYFSFFLTQHLRRYSTACLSIHIAAVHLIQSIIDSGCQ